MVTGGRASGSGAMGKCKVRIQRLTLAAGDLENRVGEGKLVDLAEEEDHIRDHELLRNALEVSIVSSSSRRIRPHVHGGGSGISGRFWASGSDSDLEVDEVIVVDDLVSSMRNLSISSSAKLPVINLDLLPLEPVEGQASISSVIE
jgi:hypothetical protein